MISTPAFLISKMEEKSFDDIRKCWKDINIIKSAITSDSSNYMGAGAPAKTKKCMPYGHIFFSGKSPTFSASCKTSTHCEYKCEVQDKRTKQNKAGGHFLEMKNRITAVAVIRIYETEKIYETDKILEKELLVMGLIRRKEIFYGNRFRRGETVYGRWKEKIPL